MAGKQQLARSFENIGEEYERVRPGFPDAAAAEILPERVGSVLDLGAGSFLAADEETRAQMIAEVEAILDADPETAGQSQFALPMRTSVFVYRAG